MSAEKEYKNGPMRIGPWLGLVFTVLLCAFVSMALTEGAMVMNVALLVFVGIMVTLYGIMWVLSPKGIRKWFASFTAWRDSVRAEQVKSAIAQAKALQDRLAAEKGLARLTEIQGFASVMRDLIDNGATPDDIYAHAQRYKDALKEVDIVVMS